MLIKIDFESDIPIYVQMKRQIIHGIAIGELKEGDNLPSVRQMAEDIGINLHTVNKAYNLLKADGFVNIDRRKGAIISSLSSKANDEYFNELKEELEVLISEVLCKGVEKEKFLDMCSSVFDKYNGRESHD